MMASSWRRQLSLIGWASGQAARVCARRLRAGPLVPSWSWKEELLCELLRARFAQAGGAPLEKIRRSMERGSALGLVDWEEGTLAGLPAAWARPPSAQDAVLLYLHGGGYGFGSFRSHRGLIERIAVAAKLPVVAIDYRLAPEHPCPAAIEDAVAALGALVAQGHGRILIGGDSAGGGLTLSTLMALRDAGGPLPVAGLCISPWVDLTMSGASYVENDRLDFISAPGTLGDFAARYAGALPLTDPRVSPLHGELTGLPPLLIQAGGAEVFRDEAVAFAERAAAAGVDVTLRIWPDKVHVWHLFAQLLPDSQAAIEELGLYARARTGSSQDGVGI